MAISLLRCGSVNGKLLNPKWIRSMMLKQKQKPGTSIFVIVFLVDELKLSKAMQNAVATNRFIIYFDVTSLYPTVNALDDYAVGFKKYVEITVDDIMSGELFGIAKVDITPP